MFVLAGLGLNFNEIPNFVIRNIRYFDFVFLENYTSLYPTEDLDKLLKLRKDIKLVDREWVENKFEKFILENKDKKIMLLVFGDPLFATTHFSLIEFCIKNKIEFKVIHSSSVLNAIANTGLFLYKFGKVGSIPFIESDVPYELLKENLKSNAHTLFLLDLDVKSKKFMSLKEALNKLLKLEKKKGEKIFTVDTFIIVCSRLGWDDRKIIYGKVEDFLELDPILDPPLCIIVPGNLNKIEEEFLKLVGQDVRIFARKI